MELPKSEVYRLAITDITDREIESKIVEQIREYFNGVLKLQKNFISHRAFSLFNVSGNDLEVEEAVSNALEEFSSFKKMMGIEIIQTSNVRISDVMDMYFNLLPPFSLKKKSEFPDAISLLAIDKEYKNKQALVISGDNDWGDFFENKDNFSFYKSISELLDELITKENSLVLIFKEQINTELASTKELIKDGLLEKPLSIYLNGQQIEIHQDTIEKIEVENINIVNIEKTYSGKQRNFSYTRCEVSFDISLTVKLRVDRLNKNISNNHVFQTFSLDTTAWLSYRVEEFENSILLIGVTFAGLSHDTWYVD
ncbi:MAG: DUF4935 domain-containing protein [Colwellia sp.]|nr:DUF4935 domain-containing protein [Colwellia sp.]